MANTWFVYILRCKDDSLYCGITNDLSKRVAAHNAGKGAKYTRSRKPCRLVYAETYETKSIALKREYAIKQMTREEKQLLLGDDVW